MLIRLEIQTDNDAFQEEQEAEVARILRALADTLEREGDLADSLLLGVTLRDINGNPVGKAFLAEA
jgi:hypothetical protein